MVEANSELDLLRVSVADYNLVEKIAEGYTYFELASLTGKAPTTLRKRVSRASKRIRAMPWQS